MTRKILLLMMIAALLVPTTLACSQTTTPTAAPTSTQTASPTASPTAVPTQTASPTASPTETKPIKIGVNLSLTGDLGAMGVKMLDGARLAVQEINAAGGVLGRQIELVEESDNTDPAKGLDRTKKLIDVDGVQAIVGPMISGTASSSGPYAAENNVVMVTPSATAADLSEKDWKPYLFRICLLDDLQAEVLADVVIEKGYTKLATIVQDNTYGKGLESALVASLEAKGWTGSQVVSVKFDAAKKDYLSELQQIKNAEPDVVFACTYADDGIIVFKQALDLGLDTIAWLGCDGNYGSGLFADAKSAEFMDKAFVAGTRTVGGTGDVTAKFNEAYAKFTGIPSEVYTDTTYDCVYAIAQAIEAAGEYDGAKIRDAMAKLQWEGASGPISFNAKGDRASGTFETWTVEKDAEGNYTNIRVSVVDV